MWLVVNFAIVMLVGSICGNETGHFPRTKMIPCVTSNVPARGNTPKRINFHTAFFPQFSREKFRTQIGTCKCSIICSFKSREDRHSTFAYLSN